METLYSQDIDEIRSREYPLLNGMSSLSSPVQSRQVEINHNTSRLFVTLDIQLKIIDGGENDRHGWKRKTGQIIIHEILVKLLMRAPVYHVFQPRIIMTYFSKPRIHMLTLVQELLT